MPPCSRRVAVGACRKTRAPQLKGVQCAAKLLNVKEVDGPADKLADVGAALAVVASRQAPDAVVLLAPAIEVGDNPKIIGKLA